jgi:hypothetical protein
MTILLIDVIDGGYREIKLADLLPDAFDSSKIPGPP